MTRGGFTLVEVLVGFVIAGLAVSLAAAVFEVTSDGISDVRARAEHRTWAANGRRWLAEAVGDLHVGIGSGGEFVGTERRMDFLSRAWVSAGWREEARTTVRVESGALVGSALGRSVVVADSVLDASFDYLLALGGDSPWVPEWRSQATAPLAVRIRVMYVDQHPDTLLLFVGERR